MRGPSPVSPALSQASLDDPAQAEPSFAPDVDGEYTLQLIVNDGELDSDPDTVQVVAKGEFYIANETDTGTRQPLCLSVADAGNPQGSILVERLCRDLLAQRWVWDAQGRLHSAIDHGLCVEGLDAGSCLCHVLYYLTLR